MQEAISNEEVQIIKLFKENVYGKSPNIDGDPCRQSRRTKLWRIIL